MLVDQLSDGLSLVYSFFNPELLRQSLGSFIILDHVVQARAAGLPYVYLGYYVANCPSMTYKNRFRPNQVLGLDIQWHDFQT